MGLLAPWLLGGLAFLAVPWLIHRRRQAPKNRTPFSSLMFLPEVPSPTPARRRVEDPWLMALRMVLLALLALAFARPVQEVLALPGGEARKEAYHVLLVDVSGSMGAAGQVEGRDRAITSVVTGLSARDQLAVVAFDQRSQVIQVFTANDGLFQGTFDFPAAVGGTNYRGALRTAMGLLHNIPEEDGAPVRRVIHLVTDLQRSGWPAGEEAFSLADGIELKLLPVLDAATNNEAVEALAVIPQRAGGLLLRARIRNFGDDERTVPVRMLVDGVLDAEQSVHLPAQGSRTLSHHIETDRTQPHRIEVQLAGADGLPVDDTRYGCYEPDKDRVIGLLHAEAGVAETFMGFIEASLAESQPVPWSLAGVTAEELGAGDAVPDVVIVAGDSLSSLAVTGLGQHLARGGRTLFIPGVDGFAPALAETLFPSAAIAVGAPHFETTQDSVYGSFSWLDYGHPIFQSFREAAYSDFSMLRFHNYFHLETTGDRATVVARLEGEGDASANDYPAIIASEVGPGRLILWAFPLDPHWTNLMRSRRFVPMLHESIALLLPALPEARQWRTGEDSVAPTQFGLDGAAYTVVLPGTDPSEAVAGTADRGYRLARPGFLQWNAVAQEIDAVTETVNVDPLESDLARFTEGEFLLRAGAVASAESDAGPATKMLKPVPFEYAYPLLALLLGGYVLETGLAGFLGRPKVGEATRNE